MKRFFTKLTIFLIIGMVVYLFLSFYSIRAGKVYRDGASIVCEEKRKSVRDGRLGYRPGKINVLFMGHSKILAGIMPSYFDDLANGKTYSLNLSLPALPIGPHFFLLKDYLGRNPPPEYIVLHLSINTGKSPSLFDRYGVQGIKFPEELLSYFLNCENKTVVFNFFFPAHLYRYHVVHYTLKLISDPSNIAQTEERNRKIVDEMMMNRGYYYIKEQMRFPDGKLPEDFKESMHSDGTVREYDPFIDPYAERFFDLASRNSIRILLIEAPYRVGQFKQYHRIPRQYEAILDTYKNVYMAYNGWRIKFYDNRFFSDPTHLNPEGTKLYTAAIFEEFTEASDAVNRASSVY